MTFLAILYDVEYLYLYTSYYVYLMSENCRCGSQVYYQSSIVAIQISYTVTYFQTSICQEH